MSNSNFASSNLTIGQVNALVEKMGGEKNVLAFLRGEVPLTKIAEMVKNLLTQVGNPVTIPPSTQSFSEAKKLVVNTEEDNDFKYWFLEFGGKVEKPFAGSQLKVQKLNRDSRDNPILDELGGEEKAETTLYEMFEFLKTAPCAWYIFYIKDARGFLRAVGAHWDVGVWRLFALRLNGPRAWGTDHHVVSRN